MNDFLEPIGASGQDSVISLRSKATSKHAYALRAVTIWPFRLLLPEHLARVPDYREWGGK